MNTIFARSALIAGCLALVACAGEPGSTAQTPAIQSAELAQLSAGGGIAGYDFYADIGGLPTRIGSLLVIEDVTDPSGGYLDETEYWRFDEDALDDIAAGSISDLTVDVIGQSETWSASIVLAFETGTSGFTAWQVNRLFDLATSGSVVWNSPPSGRVLYSVEGAGSGPSEGYTLTYFLEMDFSASLGYPEMTWFMEYSDYSTWAPIYGSSLALYEVRLQDAGVLSQTTLGVGYELKTLK